MEIIEAFTLSKYGELERNEDALFVGQSIIGVIDGVTSKTGAPKGASCSGGAFAAASLCAALKEADGREEDPVALIVWLNERLKTDIRNSVFAAAKEPPAASIVLYSRLTQRIICYGDCQLRKGSVYYKREKELDILCAERRAQILAEAIREKKMTVSELQENDIGRAAIEPVVLDSFLRYANQTGKYGFPVLGYGDVVTEYITLMDVTPGETVVLASDGYPELLPSLEASEAALRQVIETDPLLIGCYKSTKGLVRGRVSFDDRTYIRFTA